MKKQVTILLSTAFLLFGLQLSSFAQKNTEEIKKKQEEEKILQEAQSKRERAEELYRRKMIDVNDLRKELEESDKTIEFFTPGSGYAVGYPEAYAGVLGRSQNTESLEYRKTVRESSFTKELPFDVEDGSRNISITVSGACKEGEIRIKILMPGGKTYTEVLLDEYGSVNWRKSFATDDEEDKGRIGKWKFVISSKEATGNFSLSIRTS